MLRYQRGCFQLEKIIEVKGLSKRFGDVQAVKNIDFHVNAGQLFAFLGPNGAGKSTTIDIICTLLQADSGEVRINGYILGKDDFAIRSDIGVVFQTNLLDKLLTVKENLEVRGSFYGLSKSEWEPAFLRATQAAGVTEFLDRPYGKLSGGQKRRADIARALINTPKILFLDEPTTGLDPQTRKNVWDTIRKLQAEHGMTIFLTTHYMEEAASADYVVIIDEGEIIAEGTPDALRERYSSDVLKMRTGTVSEVSRILDAHQMQYELQKDLFRVKLAKTLDALPILEQCKTYLTYFEVVAGSMDDAFIAITGKQVQE